MSLIFLSHTELYLLRRIVTVKIVMAIQYAIFLLLPVTIQSFPKHINADQKEVTISKGQGYERVEETAYRKSRIYNLYS